jgi:hypothetical protein
MGAPIGNKNAAKAKEFEQALKRALSRASGNWRKGLDLAADQVVTAAHSGERWAIEQLADRFDGRPVQSVDSTMTLRDERSLSDAELIAIIQSEECEGVAEAEFDPPVSH